MSQPEVSQHVSSLVMKAVRALKAKRISSAIETLTRALPEEMPVATRCDIYRLLADLNVRAGDIAAARRAAKSTLIYDPLDQITRLRLFEILDGPSPAIGPDELIARLRGDANGSMTLALARLLLSLGRERDAVAMARLGNARERRARNLNLARIRKKLKASKEQLEPLLERVRDGSFSHAQRDQVQNLFICGAPRSGSTLLEQMLLTNSKVESVGESNEVQLLLTDLRDGKPLRPLHQPAPSTDVVVNKMLDNTFFIELLYPLMKNVKIVSILRDKISVFMSNYLQIYLADADVCFSDEALMEYLESINVLTKVAAIKYPDKAIAIRYEDLTRDPSRQLKRIAVLLGVEASSFSGDHRTDGIVNTASGLSVRKPLSQSTNNKYWRAARYMPALWSRFS